MAQRVNKRFLVILTLVVACFAALGLISSLLLHRAPRTMRPPGTPPSGMGTGKPPLGITLGH